MERYPLFLENIEQAIREYGGRGGLILTGGGFRQVATRMHEVLSGKGMVTTNLDVLMGGASEMSLSLFGRARVRLPALVGAAKVALRTGSVVLPWVNLRSGSGFRLRLEEPIGPLPRLGREVGEDHPELTALCERLRYVLEGWITSQPEQWSYWDRFHHRLLGNEA